VIIGVNLADEGVDSGGMVLGEGGILGGSNPPTPGKSVRTARPPPQKNGIFRFKYVLVNSKLYPSRSLKFCSIS